MTVTIVVVTYNSESLLPDFFDSLPGATQGLTNYELIVVDNASSDRSLAVARESAPWATIIPLQSNVGYAGAINEAVKEAKPSDAILMLNDDIRLHPGSISHLLDGLQLGGVGITAPLLLDCNDRLLRSLRREPSVLRAFGEALLGGRRAGRCSLTGEVIEDTAAYEHPSYADWASGCAWLISRRCWDAVGELDDSFFLYAEDTEYALRSRDAGYRLRLIPEARATHLAGPSHRDPRLWSILVWNRYRLFRRRHGVLKSALFRFGLIIGEFLRALTGDPVHRAALGSLLSASKRPEEVRS